MESEVQRIEEEILSIKRELNDWGSSWEEEWLLVDRLLSLENELEEIARQEHDE